MSDIRSFSCPTRIEMGTGVHAATGETARQLGAGRVLLVADAALLGSGVHEGIEGSLKDAGVAWSIFSDIEPDPSDTTVVKGYGYARAEQAEAVVALGGGSAIDVAKAICILMTNSGTVQDYEGIRKFSTPPLPLIAIPTTAGTGSEVSGSCVITDSVRGTKMSLRHAELNPANVALLDPRAVAALPSHVAMHAGMDAFVHAFESYIALDANPVTDALNLHALKLISENILPFIANRKNETAALNMLCGSALAGMAFGITGLGNVHCISRFIGTIYHFPHGLSNALCLPHVAAFNRIAAPEKYARLAALFGCDVSSRSLQDAARATVEYIRQLCEDAGVPTRLRDAGVENDRFEEIAELCVNAGYNRWNPRTSSKKDFFEILERAY